MKNKAEEHLEKSALWMFYFAQRILDSPPPPEAGDTEHTEWQMAHKTKSRLIPILDHLERSSTYNKKETDNG